MTTRMLPAADRAAIPYPRLTNVVAAFLGRYRGQSRQHTSSDLRCFLAWCADKDVEPLSAKRPDLELYLRWMQETRQFKPSTVSRRFSVVAGFYRTAVIDGVLDVSPAEHVRRPVVPAESPTLGLTHLQFEALLTAARESANLNDFALVAMLGLLGLRIFEATGADIAYLGEEHGHRVLRVVGKGGKVALVPLPPAVGRAIDRPTAARRVRSCAPATAPAWTGTPPPAGYAAWLTRLGCSCRGCTRTCSGTPSSPPCKSAELHLVHHSARSANARNLRCSVRSLRLRTQHERSRTPCDLR